MDPNETLNKLRAAITAGEYERAAEHADALDCWLQIGGFLPRAWASRAPGHARESHPDRGLARNGLRV